MRKCLALLAALALLASGCRFSHIKSDASVVVSGRALDAHGAPLSHVTVRLFKEADLGEVLFGAVVAVGSLGTVCLVPNPPAICAKAHTATTDSDGRYAFHITGADTQGTLGTEATIDVVFAAGGAGGSSTTLSFKARNTSINLPDAGIWDAAPHAAGAAGRIQLSWRPVPGSTVLPAQPNAQVKYSAQFDDTAHQSALWTQDATNDHSTAVDARVLEDQDATAAVSAHVSLGSGAQLRVSFLSPRITVHASAGAPPSRHRPCDAITGTTTFAATPQKTCGATDGNLVQPAQLTATKGIVSGVVVDLGSVRQVSLVVARGLGGMCVVEVSANGTTYRQVGSSNGSAVAVTVAGGGARFVRVRSPSAVDESLVAEVSVW